MKMTITLFIILFVVSLIFAEQLKTVFNPFTGKQDYITALYTCNGGLGMQLTDSSQCIWCESVNTSGSFTASLVSCPSGGFILMEDGTYILQEDSSKILAE